jgi:hypothetical protein
MSAHDTSPGGLRCVRLIDVPVGELLRLREHQDAMLREFALIALHRSESDSAELPRRLLALVDELTARFSSPNQGYLQQLDRAAEAQLPRATLELRFPPEAIETLQATVRLLEEADAYCQEGALLTLATPAHLAALRRWIVAEIVRQLGDAEPPSTPEPSPPGFPPGASSPGD